MIKIAINGFGRIGRSFFKVALEKFSDQIEIVAINNPGTPPSVLAHLLQYDSVYGRWSKEVFSDETDLIVENKKYPILSETVPANLAWGKFGVDVVVECTGRFTDEEGARQHILAGAKKVVLSAPGKEGIPTYVMGVNHTQYHGEELINNASCTTNCIAPVAKIISENFGILKAIMTTAHAVTSEQNLIDGNPPGGKSNDLRRARAAYINIIPTSTGAALATTQVIPELKGLFDGMSLRVPVAVGSISDCTFLLKRKTTKEEINEVFKKVCQEDKWKGIISCSQEQLVSSDIIGKSESAIVDLPLTQVVDGDLVKIFAWYDNEWGYSNRLVEQVINISNS